MIIIGEGILRHMFHGTYGCAIGLQFTNEQDCVAALELLDEKEFGKWGQSLKHPEMMTGCLNSEQLDAFKNKFSPKAKPCNSFGCKNAIHDIDGVNHSIDVGPPFEVSFDVEDKDQLKMF